MVVPAAAAIPLAQENCILNVRTGFVGCFYKLEYIGCIEYGGTSSSNEML